MKVLGIVLKFDMAWTEAEFGRYVTVGKTVIRLMYCDLALKVDPRVVEVMMMFSSSSRVVIRPCCFIQYFEMMDSDNLGTYQTSGSKCMLVV